MLWCCAVALRFEQCSPLVPVLILNFLFCKACTRLHRIESWMFMTWFIFSFIYHYIEISQRANIRNVNSYVIKDYVESKKSNLETRFLKPEYPFSNNNKPSEALSCWISLAKLRHRIVPGSSCYATTQSIISYMIL